MSANRDNTHFYGALNLASGQETLLRSAQMNGDVSALFLQKLLAAYPNLPLLLLWDRAPWHKGEAVKEKLNQQRKEHNTERPHTALNFLTLEQYLAKWRSEQQTKSVQTEVNQHTRWPNQGEPVNLT